MRAKTNYEYSSAWRKKNLAEGRCGHCSKKVAIVRTFQDDQMVDEKVLRTCWNCRLWERNHKRKVVGNAVDKLRASKRSLETIEQRAYTIKTQTQENHSKLQAVLIEAESKRAIGVIKS